MQKAKQPTRITRNQKKASTKRRGFAVQSQVRAGQPSFSGSGQAPVGFVVRSW